MANEWVKVELYGANNDGNPRRYTIAADQSVSKGALLQLLDNRTVSGSAAISSVPAGVASEDHTADIGVTEISCWTDGIFKAVVSGAILSVGQACLCAGPGGLNNQIISGAALDYTGMRCMDIAVQDDTVNVRLGPL